MPAPDVQYVLDSSFEHLYIDGATHFYMMELEPRANEIVDSFEIYHHLPKLSHSLRAMGEYFENHYLDWRRQAPQASRLAVSAVGLLAARHQIKDARQTLKHWIAESHYTIRPQIVPYVDKTSCAPMMARSLKRIAHDLRDIPADEIQHLIRYSTQI